MSDEHKAEPKRPRRARKAPRKASAALADAARDAGWTEDLQLMMVCAFTAGQQAEGGNVLDPAHFTDATVDYAKKMGFSLKVPIDMLCQSVDHAGAGEAFEAFLADSVKAFLEEMAQAPAQATAPPRLPSEPRHVHHYEKPEVLDEAAEILGFERGSADDDVGATLLVWEFPLGGPLVAHIDVVNGEPPYVDAYLTYDKKVVATLPTGGTLERTFLFDYDGEKYHVTIHRG